MLIQDERNEESELEYFTDYSFPAHDLSLGYSNAEHIVWSRAKDIFNTH